MTYERPRLETYGSVEELTENVDDGYGDGVPWGDGGISWWT